MYIAGDESVIRQYVSIVTNYNIKLQLQHKVHSNSQEFCHTHPHVIPSPGNLKDPDLVKRCECFI